MDGGWGGSKVVIGYKPPRNDVPIARWRTCFAGYTQFTPSSHRWGFHVTSKRKVCGMADKMEQIPEEKSWLVDCLCRKRLRLIQTIKETACGGIRTLNLRFPLFRGPRTQVISTTDIKIVH